MLVSDSMWRGHHSGGKSLGPVPRGVKLALQISHWPLAGVSLYSALEGEVFRWADPAGAAELPG